MGNVQSAIQVISNSRASVGLNISRLKNSVDQIEILNENIIKANSPIKDVDIAEVYTKYARSAYLFNLKQRCYLKLTFFLKWL